MELKELVENEKSFMGAAAFNTAWRALDSLSTYLCVERWGVETEANPIIKSFMDNYGSGKGLVLSELVISASLFGVAYGLNKIIKNKKTGNDFLYYTSAGPAFGAANNFLQYFTDSSMF